MNSDLGIITVRFQGDDTGDRAFASALPALGFIEESDYQYIKKFKPCPLGTYVDPSTKGKQGCQTCLPGTF